MRGRRWIIVLFIFCCAGSFLCGIYFHGTQTVVMADGRSQEAEAICGTPRGKYYTSVCVDRGDSLYGFAEEYMTEEYASADEYIAEVRQINGMHSNQLIQGGYLMIPYYRDTE